MIYAAIYLYYSFNFSNQKFLTLILIISRSNPACAVLNIGGNETIIVVGGFGAADETNKIPILDSVEIYNNATNAFEVCKW